MDTKIQFVSVSLISFTLLFLHLLVIVIIIIFFFFLILVHFLKRGFIVFLMHSIRCFTSIRQFDILMLLLSNIITINKLSHRASANQQVPIHAQEHFHYPVFFISMQACLPILFQIHLTRRQD